MGEITENDLAFIHSLRQRSRIAGKVTEGERAAIRDNVKATAYAVLPRLSEAGQEKHRVAWARIESRLRALSPKPAQAAEADRAVGHAHRLYLADLAHGMPADMYEKRTLVVCTR